MTNRDPTNDFTIVAERLAVLRRRIASAAGGVREVGDIRIVAVTKGFGAGAIESALAAGLVDIGENYAQELIAKLPAARTRPSGDAIRVHFIGRLQGNKIAALAPHVDVWQSIDRASLLEALARRAPGAAVLVQVNVSDEPAKGGCTPAEVPALVETGQALGLDVRGLMAVGRTGPPERARAGFALLRSLVDRLALAECSMGMTDDLEVAVAEGATMVRVGSALFGPRPTKGPPTRGGPTPRSAIG